MELDEAIFKIALAGREIGSGPAVAVERLLPGLVEERVKAKIAHEQNEKANWEARVERGMEGAEKILATFEDRLNEVKIRAREGYYAYGVAVGLVMAEDPAAMKTLADISDEWSRNH